MKIDCIVVDDEQLAREGICDYVGQIDFLQLKGQFKSAIEANRFLRDNEVQLMFLDINMPGLNGLEFLKSLQHPPLTIFTTAYREFASESYDVDGFDYLVKPIAFERFFKSVNKAYDSLSRQVKEQARHFFVKVDGVLVKVLMEEVLFVEGMKDYVKIYLNNGQRLITLISLKQIENQLPEDDFLRVHRSFIIAKNKVDSIEGNTLHIGEHEVVIAPAMRNEVLEKVVGNKFWRRN